MVIKTVLVLLKVISYVHIYIAISNSSLTLGGVKDKIGEICVPVCPISILATSYHPKYKITALYAHYLT